MTNLDLARAFSGHRFAETYDHLADDVVWTLVGQTRLSGRDAVAAACDDTTAALADVTVAWGRFVATADGPVVAVDSVTGYDGLDGATAVSSCDVYEFDDGRLRAIMSYAVEVDPETA